MTVVPHDKGTYLVESRSRPGEWNITDAIEKTCSCEGFNIRKKCQHLKAVLEQIQKENTP